MKAVVIGIDIGGTSTKFGIVDQHGNILAEGAMPTDTHEKVEDYLKDLHQHLQAMFQLIDEEIELKGIGIGAPNGNYYTGTIEQPPNLRWKGVTPFISLLSQYYPVPMALTNDANAAALGEMLFGGAKGMKDFIMITLGTGLGGGVVVNGQLVYGHDGFAGELGHTLVNVNGRYCGCGRRGCLETYASATGIKRTVYKLLADHNIDSELRAFAYNELTAKMITQAAIRGDKIAIEAFEYTGRILGMKLADMVVINSPEAIFLFGGLTL
ncbi:MAG: ROK family protein, partial [Bacteroidetes bacterium]